MFTHKNILGSQEIATTAKRLFSKHIKPILRYPFEFSVSSFPQIGLTCFDHETRTVLTFHFSSREVLVRVESLGGSGGSGSQDSVRKLTCSVRSPFKSSSIELTLQQQQTRQQCRLETPPHQSYVYSVQDQLASFLLLVWFCLFVCFVFCCCCW